VELDYLPESEVLFQLCLDPISRRGGCGGDSPPHLLLGGPMEAPPKRNFWEIFVKYCNFIVNMGHSLQGCRFDNRSYFRVFS
jgi:hypothetical protein